MAPLKMKYMILDLNDLRDPVVMSNLFNTPEEAWSIIWEKLGVNPLRYQVISNYDVREYKLRVVKGYRLIIQKLRYDYPASVVTRVDRKRCRERIVHHGKYKADDGRITLQKAIGIRGSRRYYIPQLCKLYPDGFDRVFRLNADNDTWYIRTMANPEIINTETVISCNRVIEFDFKSRKIRYCLVYIKKDDEVIPISNKRFYSRILKIRNRVKDKNILKHLRLWEE